MHNRGTRVGLGCKEGWECENSCRVGEGVCWGREEQEGPSTGAGLDVSVVTGLGVWAWSGRGVGVVGVSCFRLLSLAQSEDTQAAGSGEIPGAGPCMVTAWPSLGEGSSPPPPLPRLCLPRSPSQHPAPPHPPAPIAGQCEPPEAEYELGQSQAPADTRSCIDLT